MSGGSGSRSYVRTSGGGSSGRRAKSTTYDSGEGSGEIGIGSSTPTKMSPYRAPSTISSTASSQIDNITNEIQSRIELNHTLERVKEIVKQTIYEHRMDSEWYINDHGIEHGKRVERNIDEICDILDSSRQIDNLLGRPLTQEEIIILKICAHVHDLGRAVGINTGHAQFAASFIRQSSLPFTERQRELIAKLCNLHANGTTELLYGSEDLFKLERTHALTIEEAVLASILRIADALDMGKQRVEHNTIGTSREEVINRINQDFSDEESKVKLAHWYGHLAIDRANFTLNEDRLTLEIKVDTKILDLHGISAADRVKDLIRDISSTLLKDKKITIMIKGNNINKVSNWYQRYGEIFYNDIEELKDKEVLVGEE